MFERYAIFYTPTGPLADFGARWLGWDSAAGQMMPQPQMGSLDIVAITQTPRKYGLHGTLKAPFTLADHADQAALQQAMAEFAATQAAFGIGLLELVYQAGFIALRPAGAQIRLRDFAASVVTGFDAFRAPLTPADIARRRQANLSPRQDKQMLDWGYPFVFEDFHFHLTLTGALTDAAAAQVIATLVAPLAQVTDKPLQIDGVTLMGQDSKGVFHQIHRYGLTG